MKRLAVFLLATTISQTALAAPKKKAPLPPPPPQQQQEEETDAETSASDERMTTNESGFELGGHTGFALPLGSLQNDKTPPDLNKYVAGAVPFAVDAGYRINPHYYVGAYFHFAYAPTSSELCARVGGDCSSSGTQIKIGPEIRYSFTPDRRFSPWIGAGASYEVLNISVTQGQASESFSIKGWEYFRAEVGGDIHAARDVVVGPFASIGVGQYFSIDDSPAGGVSKSTDIKSTALHEWLTFGVRLAYTF